jgi:hypothetical protein
MTSMRYSHKLSAALSLALTPYSAMAMDNCEASPVFFCQIKEIGKFVRVCEANGEIAYTFGRAGREPELALNINRSAAHVTPWNGIGHDYWSSLLIPNEQWDYRLSVSYERGTEDPATLGSLTVVKNGKDIKTFECIGASVKERIETLAD